MMGEYLRRILPSYMSHYLQFYLELLEGCYALIRDLMVWQLAGDM